MYIQMTTIPYKIIPHEGIDYSVCRNFDHISRYRGLRQVVHNPNVTEERFISLETSNPFKTKNIDIIWHEVTSDEVNRLDLIANKYLGSPQYSWVISYFNSIDDGFTCRLGQKLKIPKTVTDLMKTGEILESVSALTLNLSSE